MLDLAVWDTRAYQTLVVCPLIKQDTLDRAGFAPLQEDCRVIHPHEPREVKGLYRIHAVFDIHETQKGEGRRGRRMDAVDCTLRGTRELH